VGGEFSYEHHNTGPANFWFYGLQRSNGIGVNDAEDLLFASLTQFVQNETDYRDMRYATYMAAVDMFGECDSRTLRVIALWDAVEVLGEPLDPCPTPSFQIYGDILICEEDLAAEIDFVYTVPNPDNLTISWSVPSNWESHTAGNSLIVTSVDFAPGPFPQFGTIYASDGTNNATYNVQFEDCDENGVTKITREIDESPLMLGERSIYKYGDKELPIEVIGDGKIQIFPNPSSGNVTIRIPEELTNLSTEIHIFNAYGALMDRFELNASVSQLDLQYPSGIYFAEVIIPNVGVVFTGKLIIND
jgi:hypothetical protein